MGQFDWLGQVPPPQAKQAADKVLSTPAAQKQPEPTYDDRGVAYRGYAKKKVGENQWILVPQSTRFFSTKIQNTAGFNNVVSRVDSDKKVFFCTKVFVTFHNVSSFPMDCRISDVKASSASTRVQFYPYAADGALIFDFSDSPREFRGDSFDFYTDATLGATEWIAFQLFGWDEDAN